MAKYGPESGGFVHGDKFLRLGSDMYFASPDVPHNHLAVSEGILDDIRQRGRLQPTQVDGGFVHHDEVETKAVGRSISLHLPKVLSARDITNDILAQIRSQLDALKDS